MYTTSRIYVVGAGSRLFKSMDFGSDFIAVSGRSAELAVLPEFKPDSLVLIFADPPDLYQTQALLLSVLHRVSPGSGCRIVYISTISATFGQSTVFPYEGPYAYKKRMAENVLRSRADLDVCIVRVGNVFDHGGWSAVRNRTRWAWLPAGYSSVLVSNGMLVRAVLDDAFRAGKGHHVMNACRMEPVTSIFRRVIFIPGLLSVYKLGWAKIPVKLAGRLLKILKVYLPSHDDLNSFLAK
jgi:hypothetical protein